MNDGHPAAQAAGRRREIRLYAGVIAVEVVVLVAIWLFQRYFGWSS